MLGSRIAVFSVFLLVFGLITISPSLSLAQAEPATLSAEHEVADHGLQPINDPVHVILICREADGSERSLTFEHSEQAACPDGAGAISTFQFLPSLSGEPLPQPTEVEPSD